MGIGVSIVILVSTGFFVKQITKVSPSALQSAQNSFTSSGLPPCQTETATGCDKSNQGQSTKNSSSYCKNKGAAYITASPIDISEILFIQPMGLMIGGHVTPIDHGYFYIKGATENPSRQAAVYAPFNGNISSITRTVRKNPLGSSGNAAGSERYEDYALTIEGTCTFRIRFSNMVKLGGALEKTVGQLKPNQNVTPNYSVQEGELIGYTGLPTAYGIDVWVENDDVTLTGFINPDSYMFEPWKTHIVDLFEYTKEPLKSKLLAILMRDATPRWGKIDYDIDGRLVGNWFRQGSGGYGGNKQGGEGYWDGHLSVVPDGNDPGQIDISFGNYQGQPQQFAVIGNSPDPAKVSESSGLIKYQLGQIENYSAETGDSWIHFAYLPHIRTRARSNVQGTVLLQLVGKRKLKMEIFPGKKAEEVSSFDPKALIYER